MKYLSSQQIRDTWLNFFKSKGHMIEPGASLIPNNDPTLLWINAGVAALKKYFDGSLIPECRRITNVQKCIRTNDIDNVGKTARHHTFFEMLGNFSIGDYFRKEAIAWAFEILTDEKYFALDKDKIYVTYHPSDLETPELWVKAGLSKDHLIALEGNFWQIGEGPCGPNTEVFYDRGEKYDSANIGLTLLKNDIENDRYIEIWGIVFSQFNAENGVNREYYKELPNKNIDTGAGLERIACVLQETETNFETDLFYPIIQEVEKISNINYKDNLMAFRVIADHIRACSFALSDGENFSNEGRGYVLRRLLRRAMLYGQKIDLYEPFLYKLVDVVVSIMKDFYPHLIERKEQVKKAILAEENKFIKTLKVGKEILTEIIKQKGKLLSEDVFKLYDTYGFPLDLTKEISNELGIEINEEGFYLLLNKQKELARNSRKTIESFNKQSKDLMEFDKESVYTYENNDINAKVIGLFKDGIKVDVIDDSGEVIFDNTNFYSEMGGQVSDTGEIENDTTLATVTNCSFAPHKEHLHEVNLKYGSIKIGDEFKLKLNKTKHFAIMKNHSATHLLQSALREVLGNDIKQKGSFVNEDYLRFDFSFDRKLTNEELNKVERLVNEYIAMAIDRKTLVLPIEEAKNIGAIAEFDGKYGTSVRVVTFGDISKEFCGGNHVNNTSDIGLFVIKFEESIASGVRRIEAVTSLNAYKTLKNREQILNTISKKLLAKSFNETIQKVDKLNEEFENISKNYTKISAKLAQLNSLALLEEFVKVNDKNILIKYYDDMDKNGLVGIYDNLKTKIDNHIIVLIGNKDNKHPLIVGNSLKNIAARDIIKIVTSILGGNGGGRNDLAQGSVLNIDKLDILKEELSKIG